MRGAKPLILVMLLLMFAPHVYAVTFEGPINFVGSHGGNVRFGSTFTATQFAWVNGLNRFESLAWGGSTRGALWFDCDPTVNMTVTQINKKQVAYTVYTGAAGDVTSYVYYLQTSSGGVTAPTSITANGNPATYSHSATTGITSVTTNGSPVNVLVSYLPGEQTDLYRKIILYMDLAAFIPIVIAIAYVWQVYQTGEFSIQATTTILGLVLAMTAIAYMMARYL